MGDAQRLVLLRAYDVCYVYVAYACTGTSYNTQYRKMFVSVGNVRKEGGMVRGEIHYDFTVVLLNLLNQLLHTILKFKFFF
jgi:hypothetical protein